MPSRKYDEGSSDRRLSKRSEALGRNDMSQNEMTDLYQRAKNERMQGEMFIQHIAILPFSVILFCEDNFRILSQISKTDNELQGFLDATGGVVRRIGDNNLLNHCLVFPIKCNDINNNSNVLVLGELITEDNSSFNIEYFLRLMKTKYQDLYKQKRMLRSIVTDKCYANINAIVQSQNSTTFLEYLDKMFVIRKDRDESADITFVFLCSSHMAKTWKHDIMHFFKHLDKEDVYFLCGLIGNAVNIRHYEQLKLYSQEFIKFFLCKNAGIEYTAALKRLTEGINCEENFNFQNNSEESDDPKQFFQESDQDPAKSIYSQSPFFKEFNEYMLNFNFEEEDSIESNVYYSPSFVKHFLKNSIAILPLWSAVYYSKGIKTDDQVHRPNNGFVEGHFGSLKNLFRTNLSWGKLGTIKIGRYVEAVKEKNQNALKEIKFENTK